MEDEKIVELYLDRNEEAISRTTEKYGVRLRKLAMGIVEDSPTAEECENDTYMAAWKSIPPHDPRSYLYAFLARLTRNIALNWCRSRSALKRKAHICQLSEEMEQCIPAPDDTECRLDTMELSRVLNAYLGTMPREKRDIFLRRYWYLDSIEAISKRFGYSQSKVKTVLYRSRLDLKAYLEKEGYTI